MSLDLVILYLLGLVKEVAVIVLRSLEQTLLITFFLFNLYSPYSSVILTFLEKPEHLLDVNLLKPLLI